MENPEEVLQSLDEFAKLKPKDIPRELEDYLSYVAKTGDPVYQWSVVKYLFREKLSNVITDFYEACPTSDMPPFSNVDPFNYETMKASLLERLESFSSAPFTIQRLCELLTTPRKEYSRTDKFMRAVEKNILVVSTREPGNLRRTDNNGQPEILMNGGIDGRGIELGEAVETVSSEGVNLMHSEESEVHISNPVKVECTGTDELEMDIHSDANPASAAVWDKETPEPPLKAKDKDKKNFEGRETEVCDGENSQRNTSHDSASPPEGCLPVAEETASESFDQNIPNNCEDEAAFSSRADAALEESRDCDNVSSTEHESTPQNSPEKIEIELKPPESVLESTEQSDDEVEYQSSTSVDQTSEHESDSNDDKSEEETKPLSSKSVSTPESVLPKTPMAEVEVDSNSGRGAEEETSTTGVNTVQEVDGTSVVLYAGTLKKSGRSQFLLHSDEATNLSEDPATVGKSQTHCVDEKCVIVPVVEVANIKPSTAEEKLAKNSSKEENNSKDVCTRKRCCESGDSAEELLKENIVNPVVQEEAMEVDENIQEVVKAVDEPMDQTEHHSGIGSDS